MPGACFLRRMGSFGGFGTPASVYISYGAQRVWILQPAISVQYNTHSTHVIDLKEKLHTGTQVSFLADNTPHCWPSWLLEEKLAAMFSEIELHGSLFLAFPGEST